MDEEVIYLYEINQIIVFKNNNEDKETETGNEVTIQEMWEIFYQRNNIFPIKYKTYQYFRSKGYYYYFHSYYLCLF